ncbi:MAG TPA: tetratricopeptide repeat protein [Verrucomicrobiae bacterium]|nr:tetratricopeptide repeat protein [Verrucomicrobiae bacterium]
MAHKLHLYRETMPLWFASAPAGPAEDSPLGRTKSFANWRTNVAICLALTLITFAVFGQTSHFEFLNFDDEDFISNNAKLAAGLSGKGMAWAFTANLTFHEPAAEYWEPLTLLSRLADVQLHGYSAGPHHLTNVILHLIAGLLLFAAMRRLLGASLRSGFIAALFLVHPLHVEAVAWLVARKDILNAMFFFATIWAYAWYAARPSLARYALVFGAFLCANLAKPMGVSLPFVLLLLDYWPLRRLKARFDRRSLTAVADKLPLFAIAFGVALLALLDQRAYGAIGDTTLFPLHVRVANAAISYCVYLGQTFLPFNLAILYPHPGTDISWSVAAMSAVCVTLITLFCCWHARTRPWLLVGWFWFVIVLLPVAGIVQIGEMARADRYTYVSLVGIFIAVTQEIRERAKGWRATQPWLEGALGASALAIVLSASFAAWRLTSTWHDSVSVFTRAISVTDDNYIAQANLGSALFAAGRREEGIAHYREAVRLHADVLDYHRQTAKAAETRGDYVTAIHYYEKVLTLLPWETDVHQRLADLLVRTGQYGKALGQYNEVLRYRRDAVAPRIEMARIFIAQGKFGEARRMVEAVQRREPENADAHALAGQLR